PATIRQVGRGSYRLPREREEFSLRNAANSETRDRQWWCTVHGAAVCLRRLAERTASETARAPAVAGRKAYTCDGDTGDPGEIRSSRAGWVHRRGCALLGAVASCSRFPAEA